MTQPSDGSRRERDRPWMFRTYAGHSNATGFQHALSQESRQGPDRPLGRLRSADPDRLRQRSRARTRRSRQGRRADLASRRHAHAVRADPARRDEYLDDDQRHGRLAAGALRRGRRRAERAARQAHRHDAERHHQGISLARHPRVSAGALHAADQGHDPVHHQGDAEVESDERLLLPPAGGRRDAGAGAGVCARHRDRGARHREGVRRGRGRRIRRGGRPHLVLRQCRHALHHRDCARCAHSRNCGTRSPRSATASTTRSSGCSATACRSIRSA